MKFVYTNYAFVRHYYFIDSIRFWNMSANIFEINNNLQTLFFGNFK